MKKKKNRGLSNGRVSYGDNVHGGKLYSNFFFFMFVSNIFEKEIRNFQGNLFERNSSIFISKKKGGKSFKTYLENYFFLFLSFFFNYGG